MFFSCRLLIKPFIVTMGVALCCMAFADAENSNSGGQSAPTVLREIKNPYYGDALFEFYQDHYFRTLTGLMVSQHFDRFPNHAEEAEVLRGGILLSYGLHREAGAVFEQLIQHGATPVTRDRAWFYLAKIRYQRGYLSEAQDAIGRIGNQLPPDLQEERVLLQANLMMARADFASAINVLQPLEATASDPFYVRYNLGISLMKTGNEVNGTTMLNQVGVASAGDEEHRSLRDRANLALGFEALAHNQNHDARNYFERIRLKSEEANKALLGMGWASVADKDFKQALVPWLELSHRDDNDTAELESRLAVPYAYAELGALGQSARLYNEAINAFTNEDANLSESIAAIQSGTLIDALLKDNPGDEMGWHWSINALPVMPHASHLARVMAQHEFQEAFKNYRDLQFLEKNLDDWQNKLGVFQDMLDNRRKAFAERLPDVIQQSSQIGLAAMQQRHDNAAQRIASGEASAEDKGDASEFANAEQMALLVKVNEAQQLIEKYPDDVEFSAARERVRLTAGVLTWQLAEQYPDKVWQAKKEMQSIEEQIAQATRLEADLLEAQRNEPQRFDGFEQRIFSLSELLKTILPRIAALSKEQQLAIQAIAIAELSHEKSMLTQYGTQARFALAQLYDRGTVQSTKSETKDSDSKPDVTMTKDDHASAP